MLKKILKYGKTTPIDVLIYAMDAQSNVKLDPAGFETVKSNLADGRTRYAVLDDKISVHNSFVFPKIRLLRLLGESGPAIGDCVTNPEYRGQSIYPKVINAIARELLENGHRKVFIVVNHDNDSSIRGIEKAGFKLLARIKAKRFLLFYFGVKIRRGSV